MQSHIQLLQHERPLPPSTPRYRLGCGPSPLQTGKQFARDAREEFPALDARDDGRDLWLVVEGGVHNLYRDAIDRSEGACQHHSADCTIAGSSA